jgi:hypothetical protein
VGDTATASERLRRKLELIEPFAGLPGRLLLEHPRAAEIYPRYLAAGYQVTCAMIELMEVALQRAHELDDEVSPGLVAYLERHLVEEMHHEAPGGAVLDDLRALGEDAERLVGEVESPKITSLVEGERGRIRDDHPVAILGFLEIEACHTRRDTVERLIAATGLPRDGFRQLLLHSRLDAVHAADLHEVLDSLPLEPSHERLVGQSALTTVATLTDALLDVVSERAGPVDRAGISA